MKSATLHLWNFYSRQCAPVRWNLHEVTPFTIPVAWATGPSWGDRARPLSSSDQTRGFDAGCNDNWVDINAQPFFQQAADSLATTAYMGLKAADESVTAGYKQFRSSETVPGQVPHLDINYDSVPVVSNLSDESGHVWVCDGSEPSVHRVVDTAVAGTGGRRCGRFVVGDVRGMSRTARRSAQRR